MKAIVACLALAGCAATATPAVVIEVPVGIGGQCFELPGSIRVSYYGSAANEPLALRLGKQLIDFGFLDFLWSAE